MVNFQFNLTSISGFVLLWLAARLLFGGSNQNRERFAHVVMSFIYAVAGVIALLYGWRFDPIMQIGQLLLVAAQIYWVETALSDGAT
jgi:CHASE2 domain-containing sensor protein